LLHLAEATSGIAYALSFMGPSAASAAIAAYRHLLCTGAGLQVEEQVVTRPPQCKRLVVQGRAEPSTAATSTQTTIASAAAYVSSSSPPSPLS
jgi:hypothetical protein